MRQISFEEIIAILETTGPLDVVKHPNDQKYPHQKMYIVELHKYVYLIPFVEDNGKIFLKTIIPNRDATKKYLNK